MSKKIIIPKEAFQNISVYNPSHQIRYRIISEDRNRVSAWSPIYSVDPEVVFICGDLSIPGNIKIEKHNNYISISWDAVSIYKDIDGSLTEIGDLLSYDLWIRWAGVGGVTPSDWIYKERTSSTSLNLVVPTSYPNPNPPYNNINPKYLYVEVYRPGKPILRYQEIRTFTQDLTNIDISSNAINFFSGHPYTTGAQIVYNSATPITGLSNGGTYYVRAINYNKIALYSTKDDAVNDLLRINLSGTPSGTGTITSYPFRMYSGEANIS
jgi:hypothetical protein